jgi:hypothetical protein
MFAYIDETGNTGVNIFDEVQPYFMTAAVVTRVNFDQKYGARVHKIAREIGEDHFHARVNGMAKIAAVADDIRILLKDAGARFFVANIEKRYLLTTKIFDCLFDSGENPAVPWTAYNLRMLRVILVFKLTRLITEKAAKDFWRCLCAGREDKSRKMLPGIAAQLIEGIDNVPDARSREIFRDALGFVIEHPNAIHFGEDSVFAGKGHLPNFVAFVNMLDGLDRFSKKWNSKVQLITHDEQAEFSKTFREAHEFFRGLPAEKIRWAGEEYSLQKVRDSDFVMRPDTESPGVQMADVILWLYSQKLKGKALPGSCERLLNLVFKKGYQNDFSFGGVEAAMMPHFDEVMRADFSPERWEAARTIQANVEKKRVELVEAYKRDGLSPFERGEPEHPIRSGMQGALVRGGARKRK